MANLAPVPSESSSCPNCSAPLVGDQRYCLSCGHPVSPVRLAFLDVLESERQPQLGPAAVSGVPVAYTPYVEPVAGPAWLRRYAPLFGVFSVLLLALIVGLLVGHWVTQGNAGSGTQTVKLEGFPTTSAAAASTTPATGAASTTTPARTAKSAASANGEEEKEQAEAKAEEKAEEKAPAKAPPAKALDTQEAAKLEKTTGKTKEAEINNMTTAPIEVK